MKYQANRNFLLKEIAGDYVLMARGKTALDFSAVIVFNRTGVCLWNALSEPRTEEELAQLLCAQFSATPEQAAADTAAFLQKLQQEGLLEQT